MQSAQREALSVPRIAFPTVALAIASLTLWGVGIGLVISDAFVFGTLAMTAAAYVSFTPLHDATHKAVAKNAFLNGLVGRLSVIPHLGPYAAFRYVHLEHHSHTNDAVRDPDHWSARGSKVLLPLRWMTQDLYYYLVYWRAGRPPKEFGEVVISLTLYLGSLAMLLVTGHGAVAAAWLISSRLALALLACAFDYLPHQPHTILGRDDRFRATTMRIGFGWQLLFLNQSLHLSHHLYPQVPFYKYGDVWRAHESELRAHGAIVVNERAPHRAAASRGHREHPKNDDASPKASHSNSSHSS